MGFILIFEAWRFGGPLSLKNCVLKKIIWSHWKYDMKIKSAKTSPVSKTTTGTARVGETSWELCLVHQLYRGNRCSKFWYLLYLENFVKRSVTYTRFMYLFCYFERCPWVSKSTKNSLKSTEEKSITVHRQQTPCTLLVGRSCIDKSVFSDSIKGCVDDFSSPSCNITWTFLYHIVT